MTGQVCLTSFCPLIQIPDKIVISISWEYVYSDHAAALHNSKNFAQFLSCDKTSPNRQF